MFEKHKKEAPFFTGITRGVGGAGFGKAAAAGFTAPSSFTATGGTTFESGGYKYHVFTTASPQPFNVAFVGPGIVTNLLIVAAGGAGGNSRAGGGGAGGLRNLSNIPVTAQNYTITVGAGGAGKGGDSSALNYSASGGGAMPTDIGEIPPAGPGGSGCGGPGNGGGPGGLGNLGGYSPPEGRNGGSGSGAIGGGGGGAGGVGTNAPAPYPNPGVQGGNGTLIPWVPPAYGENRYFAAGGSSTGYPNILADNGNTFGGGGGGDRVALPNTGGGGGGKPGAGGYFGAPGVVILRYVYP